MKKRIVSWLKYTEKLIDFIACPKVLSKLRSEYIETGYPFPPGKVCSCYEGVTADFKCDFVF